MIALSAKRNDLQLVFGQRICSLQACKGPFLILLEWETHEHHHHQPFIVAYDVQALFCTLYIY